MGREDASHDRDSQRQLLTLNNRLLFGVSTVPRKVLVIVRPLEDWPHFSTLVRHETAELLSSSQVPHNNALRILWIVVFLIWWRDCYNVLFVRRKVNEFDPSVLQTNKLLPRLPSPQNNALSMEGSDVAALRRPLNIAIRPASAIVDR